MSQRGGGETFVPLRLCCPLSHPSLKEGASEHTDGALRLLLLLWTPNRVLDNQRTASPPGGTDGYRRHTATQTYLSLQVFILIRLAGKNVLVTSRQKQLRLSIRRK